MREIRPVFVVGAGRSGTTPLQLALNMHPQLGVYGETQAFFVHRKFGAETGESRAEVLNYWAPMLASCCPYEGLLDTVDIRSRLSKAPSYAQILDVVLGAISRREGKSRWGEKTPAHLFRLAEVRSCFPNAQVIHIIRDPRAVVSSAIKAFGAGQFSDWSVYRTAKYWLRCFRIHQEQSIQSHSRYMLVRYEDFVARPEPTLRTISRFLGMDFVAGMLESHRVAFKYVQKENSGEMPAHHLLTQKPLDASRVDAWRKELSPQHTKLIESVAEEPMARLGYQKVASREYEPPRMQSVFFSTRWIAAEGRRIADKEVRAPYWALQRMMTSERKRQPPPVSADTATNRKAARQSPPQQENDLRRSGT